MDFDAFIDDVDEVTKMTEADSNYWACYSLYDNGMIFAAHAVMLRNIDNCVDLGERQSELYENIKQEHTLAFSKCGQIGEVDDWAQKSTPQRLDNVEDTVKIFKHLNKDSTFLIETEMQVSSAECVALAARLEFTDSWLKGICDSFFVRQISRHAHVACLVMKNPISEYLGKQKMFVRVDQFDNTVFDKTMMIVVKPLTTADCYKYHINDHQHDAKYNYFAFSSLTFLFQDTKKSSSQYTRTCAKIYVEHMKIVRYTPEYFNSLACLRFFSKMCRLWAITARQLSDVLYDDDRLSRLVAYMERAPLY